MFELVSVVFLLSIVLVMVFQGVNSMSKVITGTERRLSNLDEARTLMAVTTKDMRTATRLQAGTSPFVQATNTDVTFYANLNNTTGGPRKIRIYVDPTKQLIESVQSPDVGSVAPNYTYTGRGQAPLRRPLRQQLGRDPDLHVLRQRGHDQLAAPLTGPGLLAVYSVKIALSIRKATTFPVADTMLVNQVRLPNVDYQQVTGG